MKFNFIRQLALTLAAVGLSASIVVGTLATAGDGIPVAPASEMPFDPFVKGGAKSEDLPRLPEVVVSRLPEVKKTQASDLSQDPPVSASSTKVTPESASVASTRRPGNWGEDKRSKPPTAPASESLPPIVVPAKPVLPENFQATTRTKPLAVRPASTIEAVKETDSSQTEDISAKVVVLPEEVKAAPIPTTTLDPIDRTKASSTQTVVNATLEPPKNIKRLPTVVPAPAISTVRVTKLNTAPQSSVVQVALPPQEITRQEITRQEITRQEITPQEITPQEIKPQEIKPQEIKPQEIKPQEIKPQEIKPQEIKPQEAKPVIEPFPIAPVRDDSLKLQPEIKTGDLAPEPKRFSVPQVEATAPPADPLRTVEGPPVSTFEVETTDSRAEEFSQGDSSRRQGTDQVTPPRPPAITAEAYLAEPSSVLDTDVLPKADFPSLGKIPSLNSTGDVIRQSTLIENGEVILNGELEPVSAAMPIINECCRGCPQRTYVVAEGMLFQREGERTHLTSGFKLDGFEFKEGMRITIGRRNDCLKGWEASYMGGEPWYAYDSASSPGGHLQAAFRPGKGFTHANLDTFYNANYQEQFYRSELHNIEFNRVNWGWDVIANSLGLRYMVLNEDMRFTSLKGSDQADLEIETNNHLIGPQLGSELFYDVGGRLSFSSRYRLGAFANINDGAVKYSSEASPLSSFVNTDQNIGFSFLGDLQVNAFYKLGPRSRLRAGYELWYAWGLSTAKGNLGPGVGPSMGANMDDTSDVLFHGLSAGLEFVR